MNQISKLTISICLAFCLIFTVCGQAQAITSSDLGIKLIKNKSYNKDGKFYMNFTITGASQSPSLVKADLYNSSGKKILYWDEYEVGVSSTVNRNYGANYSNLPSDVYTLVLSMKTTWDDHNFTWKYNINHKSNKYAALSFKDYEKVLNSEGRELHKFRVNAIGGQGKKICLRIFDSNGSLVNLIEGPVMKSDNSNISFKWSGDSDIGGGYRCSSGKYTVQAYFQGEQKVIEKVYDLRIL